MRKAFIIPAIMLCVVLVSSVQAQWAKAYAGANDDNPTQALLSTEGDLLVAGFNRRFTGDYDFDRYTDPDKFNLLHSPWLTRISDNGVEAENRVFESARTGENPDWNRSDEWARSLVPTEDGGYILAGHMEKSWFDGDTSTEYNCAFVMKLSADRQIVWQRVLGNDERSTAEKILAVSPTAEGDFIAIGSTSSFGSGGRDFLVVKLDSQGQIIWQKAYGGTGEDVANLVTQTPDGGFVVVGHSASFQPEQDPSQEEAPASRIWILRLNPEGAVVWQKMFGRDNDVAASLVVSPDGGCWILGSTEEEGDGEAESDSDIFIFKLSDLGDIVFQRSFENEGEEKITHAVWRGENKVLAVGTQSTEGDEDILVIQFADTGHIDWMQIFGAGEVEGEVSQETASAVVLAGNDEIFVAGRTSHLGPEGDDLLVLRLTADGRIPDCDLMRSLERYPLRDLGALPVDTGVEFTASEIAPLDILFNPVPSPMGLVRDVCVTKKNLLRR
jgi:hypothetical protein